MEKTDGKPDAKQNLLGIFWPDVRNEKGQNEAAKASATALGYIAVSNLIMMAVNIFADGGPFGPFEDQAEQVGTVALNVVAIVLASVLAWRLYKRRNVIVAFIGLAWVALEVSVKLVVIPGRGVVIALLALLFSIHGARGALAARGRQASAA